MLVDTVGGKHNKRGCHFSSAGKRHLGLQLASSASPPPPPLGLLLCKWDACNALFSWNFCRFSLSLKGAVWWMGSFTLTWLALCNCQFLLFSFLYSENVSSCLRSQSQSCQDGDCLLICHFVWVYCLVWKRVCFELSSSTMVLSIVPYLPWWHFGNWTYWASYLVVLSKISIFR